MLPGCCFNTGFDPAFKLFNPHLPYGKDVIVSKYCMCCRGGPLGTTLVRAVSALNNFMVSALNNLMVSALGTHMVSALGNHRGLPLL